MNPPEEKNLPVLELFRKDLKGRLSQIQKYVKQIKDGKREDFDIPYKPGTILHELKAEANLIQQDVLFQLLKSLEVLFKHVQESNQYEPLIDNPVLDETLNFLQKFCEIESAQLSTWLKAEEKKAQELAHQVAQSFTRKSLKEPQPTPIVKEFSPPSPLRNVSQEVGQELVLERAMLEIFLTELQVQTTVLNTGLVFLEEHAESTEILNTLMRAAHSIKGAARVVSLNGIVQLAHAMEDCFVAAKEKKMILSAWSIDILLEVVDFLSDLSKTSFANFSLKMVQQEQKITQLIKKVADLLHVEEIPLTSSESTNPYTKEESSSSSEESKIYDKLSKKLDETLPASEREGDRVLRVTAENLNRLMGLAGETLVESHWLQPFSSELQKLNQGQRKVGENLEQLRNSLDKDALTEHAEYYLNEVQNKEKEYTKNLSARLSELEMFIRRHSNLSDRLYREVIASRMRPFADGVEAFPRMVRDLAHELKKKVRLQIIGKNTLVDREILEKLESPLSHLIRNAVDHGISTPEERMKAGKPPEGWIKLEAEHRGGMLIITVSDDGKGIDLDELRQVLIDKKMVTPEAMRKLTEKEILDFLFVPGFTTSKRVTEISGRGIGLNIVQSMIHEVGGKLQISFVPKKGISFQLQLPLTLSVIRALLVEISGEPYAFPLSRIDSALLVPKESIETMENRQYFKFEGVNIGLISAHQILNVEAPKETADVYSVILLNNLSNYYGLVVDTFLGERELVVQELDVRLGKIMDLSAGALMEDGTPLLILDVEDLLRSIDTVLAAGQPEKLRPKPEREKRSLKKRILVVDDSITVREVEKRLLQNKGYEVDVAINGMDGWNAVRIGQYHLVVTDVDMPRMNGIELVRHIKNDPKLKNLPVMIVSYKEKEEDRLLGMEAGANYYLSKGSFHEESLVDAVEDLIGKP
ncbi:hybrid sensor histidine kinase/response regulator [Parachlamydia acanthamoebae]|uniref:hybrid sensor histidine kinase/response regulator n=1 Tax=Parachlamydia acanthamoebae TaxID=83552 RepID=UPI0001C17CDB|nr:hybrid sensor histidine kinase/response regulator [Parachlamydia acanthamoebae]EFB41957.1 hypothetical protein pah_c022o294 [Parachlamydia acanthamoebae str. Hall's coccus]